MRFLPFGRRAFSDLSEREILALAISAEEDDGRIYATYAERWRRTIRLPPPCSAKWSARRTAIAAP